MRNFVQGQASGPWCLRPGGEGENFNRRNTWSIFRIARSLHCVPKFEPYTDICEKDSFRSGVI